MPKNNPYKDVWENTYKEKFMTIWSPPETIVQFAARFLKKRLTVTKFEERFPARRVLDLGCGNGATVAFFSKLGYETYGLDLSETAIEMANDYLKSEGLKADLKVGDAAALPYADGFFDVVVSYGVIDMLEPSQTVTALNEVHRVLKRPGYFFSSILHPDTKLYEHQKEVAKNTYILGGEWYSSGAAQQYLNEEDIQKLFSGKFAIKDVNLNMQKYFSPDFKPKKWSYRWHIVSEKV